MQKSRCTCQCSLRFVAIRMGVGWRLRFWVTPTTLMHPCGRLPLIYLNNAPKSGSMTIIIGPIRAYRGRACGYNGMSLPNHAWTGLTPHSTWYTITMNPFQLLACPLTTLIVVLGPWFSTFQCPGQSGHLRRPGRSHCRRCWGRCGPNRRFPPLCHVFWLAASDAPACPACSGRQSNNGLFDHQTMIITEPT